MKKPGTIRKLSPASEHASPASSRSCGWPVVLPPRARATTSSAIASASGLKMRCNVTRLSAPVATESAAASISSTSSTVMRPCRTAPTDHRPAARAASQTVDCASGIRSACHKNNATQFSSTTNWIAPNQATPRLTGG